MNIPRWMKPAWYGLLFIGIGIGALMVSPDNYQLMMRTAKFLNFDSFLPLAILLASFTACCFVAQNTGKRSLYSADESLDALIAFLAHKQTIIMLLCLYLLVVLAYIVWFLPTFNLSVLTRILVQHAIKGREVGTQISGVTTLTQIGPVIAAAASLALCVPYGISNKVKRFYRFLLVSLIFFAFYRALIWSERLGLIEILLPAFSIYFCFKIKSSVARESAPLFASVAMVAVFGAFEYFRSWQYYKDQYSSIVGFSIDRFLSYYYTSFNNFGLLHERIGIIGEPANILRFLYTLPIPYNPLAGRFDEINSVDLKFALQTYVNPEFNLFTAPGLVYLDVGTFAGAIVYGFLGYVSGRLFVSFKRINGVGIFLYPIWMVGLLEIGRQLQWTSGREFPQIVIALIFAALFNKFRRNYIAKKREEMSI